MEFALQILFVCTGNICRSPTAERLLAAWIAQLEIPNAFVASAGTHAVIGHAVHREAARVLTELGGDPSGFAARQLTARIAASADLVLTMTAAHRDAVLELAPQKLHRTFTMGEGAQLAGAGNPTSLPELAALRPYANPNQVADIPDPMGKDPEAFAAAGTRIAELLPPIVRFLRRASS